ncbi:hypothetical protein OG373_06420 [Streptomyces avidinii]|uniref:hypothetical protein n=1 Tax=Streptomyces avidinii TaxID=1895 RepID=UPI003869A462|nr:hypothetical protein OG373_06420 [Streptomyces avidinii]
MSVGCDHVLALTADGAVKAWGKNAEGQLGNDSTEDSKAGCCCSGPATRMRRRPVAW